MSDIFVIHLSISGHLLCFSVLAIVNNAAVNMGMHIVIFISLKLLDHTVVLLLIFEDCPYCFP